MANFTDISLAVSIQLISLAIRNLAQESATGASVKLQAKVSIQLISLAIRNQASFLSRKLALSFHSINIPSD